MLALVHGGMSREDAYTLVQHLALAAWEGDADFHQLCLAEPRITTLMSPAELDALFDPQYYLRNIGPVYARFCLDNVKEERS